jgi:hypothetical protein
MKLLLLAGTAFLGLAASGSAARAVPFDFMYTGSLVTFMVPTTDTYQILAFGAQGGNITRTGTGGGLGAEIGGVFSLTAGEVLEIAVGGAGMAGVGAGGGGGGSFVVGPGNAPLVIAGGGGGSGAISFMQPFPMPFPGGGGQTGPDGGGAGGTGGNGGGAEPGFPGGGGGGGFLNAGGNSSTAGGGGAFPGLLGGFGSAAGGFGGGGGGTAELPGGAGGGGGGYSGGGGGFGAALGGDAPGGGGSFDAGIDQILMADFRAGNGEVVITEIAAAVPEPSSVALLGAGLLSLAAVWRRRGRLSHRPVCPRSGTVCRYITSACHRA